MFVCYNYRIMDCYKQRFMESEENISLVRMWIPLSLMTACAFDYTAYDKTIDLVFL